MSIEARRSQVFSLGIIDMSKWLERQKRNRKKCTPQVPIVQSAWEVIGATRNTSSETVQRSVTVTGTSKWGGGPIRGKSKSYLWKAVLQGPGELRYI